MFAALVIPMCSKQLNAVFASEIIWLSWSPVTIYWDIVGCPITPNKLAFIASIIKPNPVMLYPKTWRFTINEAHFWLACYTNEVSTVTKAISASIFPVETSHWRGLENKLVTRVSISIPATWTIWGLGYKFQNTTQSISQIRWIPLRVWRTARAIVPLVTFKIDTKRRARELLGCTRCKEK